ncbi:MAG TPA: hypothetical protein VN948_19215 [Terriglobales bacterium]|nr:hypothetical protein [Terriglobales bacterium]
MVAAEGHEESLPGRVESFQPSGHKASLRLRTAPLKPKNGLSGPPAKDPVNPFDGGEVKFFGLLRRGKVRSSRESGQYFAHLNNITGAPEMNQTQVTDGVHVDHVTLA